MKKTLFAFTLLFFAFSAAFSQIHEPVKWSVATKKLNNNEAVVFIKATIENGWHIYSISVPSGGPVATSFNFAKSADYTLNGKTLEPKPKSKYEDVFKMDVAYHNGEVVFQQKVKLNSKKPTKISGTVDFMSCDKTRCLPPDEYSFAVTIK
ncbi:protein-disulfide reductase DsbD domain-containing protein [Sphingobacterium corticis]|uniref:Protein-disulfide reductase DsbD domain-containing protein n=1 Tax=Sphingobacterium corticis TaxID=1812823 RepID=A0ABW5NH40_9SPHI